MHARKSKTDTGKQPEKPQKKKETLPESVSGIAEVLVSGLFIITFVVQSFVIPSASMENTLLIGDHLFVDRLAPAERASYTGPIVPYRQVHRNDIVVFIHPDEKYEGMYLVKRIMGVPGDRIHLRNGVVYRNGERLNEPYVIRSQGNYDEYRDEFPARPAGGVSGVSKFWPLKLRESIQGDDLVVPPGNYFAMGDNREESLDSRYWGFIPQENIIGRPLFIYWSFVTPHGEYDQTTMAERARFLGYQIVHFFDKTRWGRTFHRVQ